ncbi:hypothetical protein FRC03_008927 [Tulasnella sp. 419]|nr:hypothetical protein FRC03_008927 [Tulasnella sp. 419]
MLSQEQQDALAQLQAITNADDLDNQRAILESVGWDVQKAVHAIFDGSSAPISSNQAGPSRPTTRTFERMELDDSSQGATPRSGPSTYDHHSGPVVARTGLNLFSIITWPVTITFQLFTGIVNFVFRILRIPLPRFLLSWRNLPGTASSRAIGRPASKPLRGGNPKDVVDRWVRELEDETGAMCVSRAAAAVDEGSSFGSKEKEGRGKLLPDFWIGSYESALKAAKEDVKVLCAILVSEEHDDVPDFKRNVLTDPDLVRVLTDNQFIVWGGDVRDSESYQTALKLGATTYPFVAFVSLHPRAGSAGRSSALTTSPQLSIISRHEGSPETNTSASNLYSHIVNTLLPRVTPFLTRIRNEKRLRQQERELREEQDRAFREAERKDRERMEKRIEEERRKKQDEERKRLEIDQKLKKVENRKNWRRWAKRNLIPPEPSKSSGGSIRIGVRLPNGTRLLRMFEPSTQVETLYTFVDISFLSQKGEDDPSIGDQVDQPPASYQHEFEFELVTSYPRKEIPLVKGQTIGDVAELKGGANLAIEMKANRRSLSEDGSGSGGNQTESEESEDGE